VNDAYALAQRVGPAWRRLVDTIDEISGVNKKAIEETNERFQAGGQGSSGSNVGNGTGPGDRGSDIHPPVGA
jgi:hypothetical protein